MVCSSLAAITLPSCRSGPTSTWKLLGNIVVEMGIITIMIHSKNITMLVDIIHYAITNDVIFCSECFCKYLHNCLMFLVQLQVLSEGTDTAGTAKYFWAI